MKVYRLVDQQYDPITVGDCLSRASDHSNQKLGNGMYFAVDRQSALDFADKKHGHTYTHLLECELVDIDETDLIDLRLREHRQEVRNYEGRDFVQKALKCCRATGRKGIFWQAGMGNDWTEVCLLEEYIPGAVRILGVERRP